MGVGKAHRRYFEYAPNCSFDAVLTSFGSASVADGALDAAGQATCKAQQFPRGFKVVARADLGRIKSWYPKREGRRYAYLDPASSADKAGFKQCVRDLLKRNRAAVVEGGAPGPSGETFVWHFVPPSEKLMQSGVVPRKYKSKLVGIFGVRKG